MAEAAGIILNEGQERALGAILDGKNVFLTGDAGTGKSAVVDRAKRELEKAGRKMLLCAPTGIAAQSIGGVTIHKLFGLYPGAKLYDEGFLLGLCGRESPETFTAGDVAGIIVDEIGAVRRDLMNAMVAIILKANSVRRLSGLGDLQIVLVGDFMQLPPIVRKKERKAIEAAFGCEGRDPEPLFYAFEAGGWAELGLETHLLAEQVRQSEDEELRRNLDLAQKGDGACLPFFNARVCEGGRFPDDAVFLCGRNDPCDERNEEMLSGLDGMEWVFCGEIEGICSDGENLPAPMGLKLKKGARVMCTANGFDDRSGTGYFNGSLGYVEDFIYEEGDGELPSLIRLELDSGKGVFINRWKFPYTGYRVRTGADGKKETVEEEVGSYRQYPLRLAYALTHHKSQGQTLDKVVVDPETWHPGQLYVVLSRVRRTEDLYLTRPIRPEWLKVSEVALSFRKNLRTGEPVPVSASSSEDLQKVKERIRRDEAELGGRIRRDAVERASKQQIRDVDQLIRAALRVSPRIRNSVYEIGGASTEKLESPLADILNEAEMALDELDVLVPKLRAIRKELVRIDPTLADSDRSAGDVKKIEETLVIARKKLDNHKLLSKQLKTLEKTVRD